MFKSNNPLDQVRLTCLKVVSSENCKSVKINNDAIDSFAKSTAESVNLKGENSFRDGVEWDACGWHYNADAANYGPLTCQYVFVMDSLNFCFWPTDTLEYDTLALSLKKVLEDDNDAFSAIKLSVITDEILQSWFKTHILPNISERSQRLRELGQGLLDDFDGLAENVVIAAKGSAVKFVTLILRYFQGFRDTIIYKGMLVHFYKRAQILVGDVWAAYGRPSKSIDSIYSFIDIDQLTMFADYRVPQILRQVGVLEYSTSLASLVDNKIEIAFGSDEETEIRACTVIAVELLQKALIKYGLNLLVLEVDWLLWQKGELIKDEILPHHRTLTIYY